VETFVLHGEENKGICRQHDLLLEECHLQQHEGQQAKLLPLDSIDGNLHMLDEEDNLK
jgi:hypothetical protein